MYIATCKSGKLGADGIFMPKLENTKVLQCGNDLGASGKKDFYIIRLIGSFNSQDVA